MQAGPSLGPEVLAADSRPGLDSATTSSRCRDTCLMALSMNGGATVYRRSEASRPGLFLPSQGKLLELAEDTSTTRLLETVKAAVETSTQAGGYGRHGLTCRTHHLVAKVSYCWQEERNRDDINNNNNARLRIHSVRFRLFLKGGVHEQVAPHYSPSGG